VTLSFNLAPGVALGDAVEQIDKVRRELNMPFTVQGAFHDRHRSPQGRSGMRPGPSIGCRK
jgi:multidrug efflux pump subunit AcrB